MSVNNIFCEQYCIVASFFFCPNEQTLTEICSSFSARGTCQHHRWHCVHDGFAVIGFLFHQNTHRLFYQTADIIPEKTLILFSGRYWANAGHEFTIYMDFNCSQREQHYEPFFFCSLRKIPHIIALSKQTATIRLMDWQTSGSSTPLFLSVCALVPYVCFCHQ